MKKLVALASMAVLLCASASFAKKALDEEEMDLVTAAGQPSIMDIEVITTGVGERVSSTESASHVFSEIDASGFDGGELTDANGAITGWEAVNSAAVSDLDATAHVGEFDLNIPFAPSLNVDYSDADIGSFDLDIGSGSIGSLTASAWASTYSTVTGASASVTAAHHASGENVLNVQSSSQTNLRAMAVNNIVGENQIANAVNIQTGALESDGEQINEITQSWGSSYDWTYAEGDLIATSVAAGDANNSQTDDSNNIQGGHGGGGGFATSGQAGPGAGDIEDNTCILDNCHIVGAESHTGDGGAVDLVSGNNAVFTTGDLVGGDGDTSVGVLQHLPLTVSADKITHVFVESAGDATVDVSETDESTYIVHVDTDSQTDLAALFVNNIAGMNQIASATNITAHGSMALGLDNGDNALIFDSPINGIAEYAGAQVNLINQYRGTPHQQFNPYAASGLYD